MSDFFTQSGAGAVTRTVDDKLREVVSVTDFGAVGDGNADDLPAFNAAIAAMQARGGGTVFVPKGTYSMGSATLVLRPTVSLVGDESRPVIKHQGAGSHAVEIGPSPTPGRLSFKNFVIDGNGRDAVRFAPPTRHQFSGTGLRIENVAVVGTWINGFTFANVFASTVKGLSTEDAHITNACFRFLACVNGVHLDGLYTGTSRWHEYCFYIDMSEQAEPSVASADQLPPGSTLTFTNMNVQGGKYGIFINRGRNLTFVSPYFENVAQPLVVGRAASNEYTVGVEVLNPAFYAVIPDNPHHADRGPLIQLQHAQGVRISPFDMKGFPDVVYLTAMGGGGSGFSAYALIGTGGSIVGAVVANPGSGYTSPPVISDYGTNASYTAVMSGDRVVSVGIANPGSGLVSDGFPVALSYGANCRNVVIEAPYPGLVLNEAAYAFVGRESTATGLDGVSIVGDQNVEGATVTFQKAGGFGYKHVALWRDGNGAQQSLIVVPPLVAIPN